MNLSEIKRKYKEILESSHEGDCSSSDDDKVLTLYEQMQSRKKCVLSSSAFNKENRRAPSNEKEELALRERLAQAIDTIAHKDAEIKRLNDGKSTSNEERRLLEREMEGLRRDLADRDTRLVHKQAEIVNLQSKMQELERSLTEQQLSEELAKNQLKYYEMEQDKFKRAIQEKEKDIKKIRKVTTRADAVLRENDRLKADVNRLAELLAQEDRYKMLIKMGQREDFKLSYLGKPHQELKDWYPRELIGETEQFLKGQAIGYNNKEFVHELVKFIKMNCIRAAKQAEDKLSKRHESQVKEVERRLNHSLNFKEVEIRNRMRHSIGVSRSRRINATKTKRHTEAMLEKSITCNSKITIDKFAHNSIHKETIEDLADSVSDIVAEFREGLAALMEQQPLPKKKTAKLCDWLADSLREVLRNRRDGLKLSVLEV